MHEADAHAEFVLQGRVPRDGGGIILIDIHPGADPESALAAFQRAADGFDDLVDPRIGNGARFYRFAARRFLVEDRDIEIAVHGLRERARDRRGAHHQHVRAVGLADEAHAVGDAEPVLLVDDDQAEIAEGYSVLKKRVGARHDLYGAVGERHQRAFAGAAPVAPGEHRDGIAERREQLVQRVVLLAGQHFGRRHEG